MWTGADSFSSAAGRIISGWVALLCFVCWAGILPVFAQETASPTPTATPTVSSTLPAARSIRISFLPPPLEGKISLGIYNEWDQLVRILHQEADLDEFTIGADALVTKWDGKDQDGFDSPPGNYYAKGFLVAPMPVAESKEEVSVPVPYVRVRLIANPLNKDDRPLIELGVGFDDENVYLKTPDGLPLFTLATLGDTKAAALASIKENKIILVSSTGESSNHSFRITGVDKMMAFDAGDFELK